MRKPSTIALAWRLDMVAGDPEWFPHPVRAMGRAIAALERVARPGETPPPEDFARGAAVAAVTVAGSIAAASVAIRLATLAHPALGLAVEVALAWTALATRDLVAEASAVLDALDAGDTALARRRVARIVGRDTDDLDEAEIRRATIETVAESLSDGVVAPLLFLAVGGVPLAIGFKAVSTLDSTIGHREAPYTYFGRAAARVDDAANFVPARATAALIAGGAALTGRDARGALRAWRRDGAKHASPNSGRPEAAMAGALGVRLGGASAYDGVLHERPYLNAEGGACSREAARAALRLAVVASAAAGALAVVASRFLARRWRDA